MCSDVSWPISTGIALRLFWRSVRLRTSTALDGTKRSAGTCVLTLVDQLLQEDTFVYPVQFERLERELACAVGACRVEGGLQRSRTSRVLLCTCASTKEQAKHCHVNRLQKKSVSTGIEFIEIQTGAQRVQGHGRGRGAADLNKENLQL